MRRLENINEYNRSLISLQSWSVGVYPQINMGSLQYIYEYFSKFNSIAKYLPN